MTSVKLQLRGLEVSLLLYLALSNASITDRLVILCNSVFFYSLLCGWIKVL